MYQEKETWGQLSPSAGANEKHLILKILSIWERREMNTATVQNIVVVHHFSLHLGIVNFIKCEDETDSRFVRNKSYCILPPPFSGIKLKFILRLGLEYVMNINL